MRRALLQLVEQKPLDQISIQEITSVAGLSYPTFFRQFSSKENLLDDIAHEELHNLQSLTIPLFDDNEPHKAYSALCHYVDNHRTLWTTLLTAGAASTMREELIRIASEMGRDRKHPDSQAHFWLPNDLASRFVVSTIFEILAWWLRQPRDYPIENIKTLLDVLVVRSTTQPKDVKLI
ncbi:MAG TPA: TetR/AcrR family transcriptional regulator [Spongiibacteraceae bacterium]|nr:TetR/AcrR family transcriptional regulator [Spongiibacteraceae bacterium]